MFKSVNYQAMLGTFTYEDNPVSLSLAYAKFDDSDGEVQFQLTALYKQDIWAVTGLSTLNVNWGNERYPKSYEMGYSRSYNTTRKRGLTSETKEQLKDMTENWLREHSETWEQACNDYVNNVRILAGGQAETEQIKHELEEAKTEAEQASKTADINTLILENVVKALEPEIKERIRENIGVLADAVPTRLEVKLENKEIVTSEAIRHEKFDQVLSIVAAGHPVWLVGEAGTGKSVLCEQVAEAIDAEYYYSGAILDEYAGLKGFIDANGVKHGTQFTRALQRAEEGVEVVCCLDECDGSTPEVLLVLNNLLSGGMVECMGKAYKLRKNLHIIACGNTNGRGGNTAYTRSIIDSATLDRFMMVTVDYSPAIELAAAHGDEKLQEFSHCLRVAAKKCGVDLLLTYRAITRLAELAPKIGYPEAMIGGMLRGLDESDITTLYREVSENISDRNNPWLSQMNNLTERQLGVS